MANNVKAAKSQDFLVTETRKLNKNGSPYGFKQTQQREMKPWASWALDMLGRLNNDHRKHALLGLIPALVDETCETMLKAGIEGARVTDIRFKLCQEFKDGLLSRLGETVLAAALAAREGNE